MGVYTNPHRFPSSKTARKRPPHPKKAGFQVLQVAITQKKQKRKEKTHFERTGSQWSWSFFALSPPGIKGGQTCKPANLQKRKRRKMPRRRKSTRAFTCADIVKFHERCRGSILDQVYVYTLKRVELLRDITPPAWNICYMVTYGKSPFGHTAYYSLIVLQYTSFDGTPYLNIAHAEALPEGCSTVQEEDEEMQRRRLAEEARWEKEREQRDGSHNVPQHL